MPSPAGRQMQELEQNLDSKARLNYLLQRLRSKVGRIPVPTSEQTPEEQQATISVGVFMVGQIRRFFHTHRKALARAGVRWSGIFGKARARAADAPPMVKPPGKGEVKIIANPELVGNKFMPWEAKQPRKGFVDRVKSFFRRGGARGR